MTAIKSFYSFVSIFLNTAIGRKLVMALTGVGAVGFLVVHLLGNLVIFDGAHPFNRYAETLHAFTFLPVLEAFLALTFLAHIAFGIYVTLENRAARPCAYEQFRSAGARTVASMTMIYSGLAILAFVAFHLWTIRFGPGRDVEAFTRVRDVLSVSWQAVCYLAGVMAVGFHVSHGASSALLSLGLRHPIHDPWIDLLGKVFAFLLAAGFAAVVLSFLFWGGPGQ